MSPNDLLKSIVSLPPGTTLVHQTTVHVHKEPLVRPKFLGTYGKYRVSLVSGTAARDKSVADEDVGDYMLHVQFPDFVPEGQIFVSDELTPAEQKIATTVALEHQRLLDAGESEDKAYDHALAYDRHVRQEASHKKFIGKTKRIPDAVYVRKWGETNGGETDVWIVSGREVRDQLMTDFILGGNHRSRPFIPEGQLWCEDTVPKLEVPYIVLHELGEEALMDKGWEYHDAHHAISKMEYTARHHGFTADDAKALTKAKILAAFGGSVKSGKRESAWPPGG